MPLSNFPTGFNGGLSVRGIPVFQPYVTSQSALGRSDGSGVYWVDSVNGLDGNKGTYGAPLKTLARAIVLAKQYDIIMLKPGHAETISAATALTLSVADVSIVGWGARASRPTFTLDTATTSTINVTANNVSIQNVVFVANFAAIVTAFTLTTAIGFTLSQVEVKDTSSILNFLAVVTTDTTSNHADGLTIVDSKVTSLTATAATSLLTIAGTNDAVTVQRLNYKANTTDVGAPIVIATGKILTNSLFDDNKFSLVQATGSTTGILITTNGSTNTGWITGNKIQGLDATSEILVTASSGFLFSQNYYAGVADKSGYLLPAADS